MSAAGPRPVSIFDVAKLAGVSHQTVSRVINDAPMVADATRARVKAAIADLGYRPNRSARALAGGAVRSVTVLTTDTSLYGTAETLRGIEDAARAAGFSVLISVMDPDQDYSEADILGRLSHDGAAAIVIAHDEVTTYAMRVLHERQPGTTVATGGEHLGNGDRDADWLISLDDRTVAARATRYLLDMGHRTVHYLAIPGKASRRTGWAEALAAAGITAPEAVDSGWSVAAAAEAATGLVADPAVTAILCGNDDLAFGVLHAAHRAGRSVPGDLSVVGFDDYPLAAYHVPPLTTVDLDFRGVGRGAFDLLRYKLEGGSDPRPSWRSPELVVRETSGPPRQ
ncbi:MULTISPECIES: LacI family DNA-binding transcriptional regulator [Glycomyces]|uniref:DNA-binding LacI/PurR family transcriptional regulator n=2 Tax=Glycomyces TaxID=58113 RepID=A0A9X3PJ66_9ACTN|nr:LacI family DNA-binding transcriptional regulator [Glycomyces lechevalierae]MDA1383872.1 LacI family DNA-binding transcriptional regulator [Glycomyces lechevalierae]MDR7341137.1 DNA-binding LacI/PurR family transcriptional regulator [Glycomyces lechevalierae]